MQHRAAILEGRDFTLSASIRWEFQKHTEVCDLKVHPDELIGIGGQYYADELMRYSEQVGAHTFKNKKSFMRSALQYAHIFENRTYEKEWGLPNLKVRFIFDSVERMH